MDLEKEILEIKEEHKYLEMEKAWEASWHRKLIIFIMSYILIVIFFYLTMRTIEWLNSMVLAIALLISIVSLPIFKKFWMRRSEFK